MEAQVVAAQDQALAVQTVQHKMSVPLNCRVCSMVPEYVDHLLSGCTPLAATMYKQRHNRLANIVHWSLLKCFISHNYWDHAPSAVLKSPEVKILWDFIFILTTY